MTPMVGLIIGFRLMVTKANVRILLVKVGNVSREELRCSCIV